MNALTIGSENLRTFTLDLRSVRAILPLAGDPGGRPELAGVYLTGSHVVATDSHVMGVVELAEPCGLEEPVLLPSWAAALVCEQACESVLVAVDGRSVLIGAPDDLLAVFAMPAELYPDWQRVVPFCAPCKVRVSRRELRRAVGGAPEPVLVSWPGWERSVPYVQVGGWRLMANVLSGGRMSLAFNHADLLRTLDDGPAGVVLEAWSSDVPLVMRDTLPGGVGERTRLLLPLPEAA